MQKASIMLTKILAPVVQLVNISHPITSNMVTIKSMDFMLLNSQKRQKN